MADPKARDPRVDFKRGDIKRGDIIAWNGWEVLCEDSDDKNISYRCRQVDPIKDEPWSRIHLQSVSHHRKWARGATILKRGEE